MDGMVGTGLVSLSMLLGDADALEITVNGEERGSSSSTEHS